MADTIQLQLERMIPELEDLQLRGICSQDEIAQIVQRRKDFEYALKRMPVRKIDFLRYIEYELNLNSLRAQRKKRLGISKHSLSDGSILQHVHMLFDRALKKFYGDIQLWVQYIDFCKKSFSNKILSQVFTRALQFHPRCEGIWIEAASWEYQKNGNMESARVLMQRALRLNDKSKKLWLEYYRLELLIVHKLRLRREVLGLNKKSTIDLQNGTGTEDKDSLTIPALDSESSAHQPIKADISNDSDEESAKNAVLDGKIAQIVFRSALKKMGFDFDFCVAFMNISDEFLLNSSSESFSCSIKRINEFIMKTIQEEVSNRPECMVSFRNLQCRRPLSDTKLGMDKRLNLCIERFENAIAEEKSLEMGEKFADFLVGEILKSNVDENGSKYLANTLYGLYNKFFDSPESEFAKFLQGESQEKISAFQLHFVDLLLRVGAPMDVLLERLKSGQKQLMLGSGLFLYLLDVTQSEESLDQVIETGLSQIVDLEDRVRFLAKAVELQRFKLQGVKPLAIEKSLKHILTEAEKSANQDLIGNLRVWILDILVEESGVSKAREFYADILRSKQLPKADCSKSFLYRCIDVEVSALCFSSEALKSTSRIVCLYEKAVDLFGCDDMDVWVRFIQFYASVEDFKNANKVQWRARQIFEDAVEIMQAIAR